MRFLGRIGAGGCGSGRRGIGLEDLMEGEGFDASDDGGGDG